MPNKHQSLTYRWMEEVWNNGRESAIDEMLDANAVVNGIEGINEPGPNGFKVFYQSFRQQFPSVHVEVDEVFSEGDFETARCTVDGTTANGQDVHFTGMTCLRISNGKIVEAWNNFDFMTMYHQLGFKMAPPAELIA
jgi:predicted ester cyclase